MWLVVAWRHYSSMRDVYQKIQESILENYKLENTLRNKISCSKPNRFYRFFSRLSSHLRLNSWELEARNGRFNVPVEVSCLLISEYQSNANYNKCPANNNRLMDIVRSFNNSKKLSGTMTLFCEISISKITRHYK